MSMEVGGPEAKHMFLVTAGLLIASIILPVGFTGLTALFYLTAQICLSVGALSLAVYMAVKRPKGVGRITGDLSANTTVCAAAGVAVQALYHELPLVPLLFFAGYPYTVFARRFTVFWVPASILAVAAAGRYLFIKDMGLAYWTAAFLLYSAALYVRISRDRDRIEDLSAQLKRINSDAKEMMDRISQDGFAHAFDRVSSVEAARAFVLDEDDFLQGLLRWGCRVFNARTGILLVPDEEEPGFFRMRAAAVQPGMEILEGPVPGDKGFIHISREREGALCVSDASSAGQSLSFYPEDTQVGSFLVKIVIDPRWGKDAASSVEEGKIRCVLYFDSETVGSMSLNDLTTKRLEEFGSLVLKAMDNAGHLQKLTKEVSSRDTISRYARRLTESLIPQDIAKMALDAVVEAVPECDGAVVMLNEDGLSIVASDGDLSERLGSERILREEPSYMGLFLRRFAELESGQGAGDTQIAEIVIDKKQARKTTFFRKNEKLEDIISFAAIPSYMAGTENPLKGAIAVVSSRANFFKKYEREDVLEELRTIAGMMAPALDNANQHKIVNEQSRTDGLTGLLNRRTFEIILDGKINNVSRGYFKSMAVIMVDGDHFKTVNDTYGHPVGDEVLVEIANRLKEGVRKNDAVARYGGEEFVVVLDNAGEKEANEIAEKMRHSIRSKAFTTTAGKIQITASFGFSVLSGTEGVSNKELLEQADQALYHAKESGRDQVVSFSNIGASRSGIEPAAARIEAASQEDKIW